MAAHSLGMPIHICSIDHGIPTIRPEGGKGSGIWHMNSKHQLRSSLRKKYMAIAVLAAIIYVFFLSSKLWMPNADNASNYTEIGTVPQIGNSDNKVTLINWEYSRSAGSDVCGDGPGQYDRTRSSPQWINPEAGFR